MHFCSSWNSLYLRKFKISAKNSSALYIRVLYNYSTTATGLVLPQHCPKDYWGENCDKRCELHCYSYYGCDKISGTCYLNCDSGYWGNYCNQRCPVNCGSSNCRKNDGYCNSCRNNAYFIGNCSVSCSEKWPNCKTCRYVTDNRCTTCNPRYWNTNCDNNCTAGCLECDKNSGQCLRCLPRFWGNNCSDPCPGKHCTHCRLNDGSCEKCDEGFWGEICQHTCDLIGCEDSICGKHSGRCENCKRNYWVTSVTIHVKSKTVIHIKIYLF